MSDIINKERLTNYTETVKELDHLLTQKNNLIQKLGIINGVDYTRIKVTTGNNHKMSEQERYAIALQTVNIRIDELKFWLKDEYEFIKKRLAQLKRWEYRKLIVLRHLEQFKWAEIVRDFFEFEDDFEEEKHFKYRDKVMDWYKQALNALEKTNTK